MSLDLPRGGSIDTSGGGYLTYKAAKKSIFVARSPPGPLSAKMLAKLKRPRIYMYEVLMDHEILPSRQFWDRRR